MILLTGGAGFIGSNLLAQLNARGLSAIAIADHVDPPKQKNIAKHRYSEIVPPEQTIQWLDGRRLDAVLHMGAISSTTVTDEGAVMAANFDLPMRLLDWCAQTKTPLIYASSAATYGDGSGGFADDDAPAALAKLSPLNLYGKSKARFDLAAAERAKSGGAMPPQWVGLKFFNVFGPNEYHKGDMRSVLAKVFPGARAGMPVRLFQSDRPDIAAGEIVRDFVYVEDAANVVLWLLDHPHVSGIYNVGTGQARSFTDMMRAMFKALEKPPLIQRISIPPELAGRYQYFTEARMERLRAAGYDMPFTPLETAVTRYVTKYLDSEDPYR